MNNSYPLIDCPSDPCGYYKGQLYKAVQKVHESHKILTLDWLTLSLTACLEAPKQGEYNPVQLGNDIVIVPQLHGWKRFTYSWDVYYHGEKVALLGSHPRKEIGVIKADFCSLQLLNHVLQTDLLWEFLLDLFDLEGVSLHNVQEVHIAMDGCSGLTDLVNKVLFRGAAKEQIRKVGRNSATNLDPVGFNSRLQQAAGFYVGSRKSDRFIRIYDKSKELEVSNKLYFKDLWAKNGIDQEEPVERFEMVLRSKELRKIKDFDLWKLADTKYLASLLKTGCKNLFEFAWVDESDSNTRRWERVEIFDWENIGGKALTKLPKTQSTTDHYKAKLSIHLAFKCLMIDTTCENQASRDMQYASDLADRYGLRTWMNKKIDFWRSEYRPIGQLYNQGFDPMVLKF